MNLAKRIKEALRTIVERAGNQLKLEEKTGVSHSNINMFLSGKRSTGNMTINTLEKLFPELQIFFFKSELPGAALPAVERKVISMLQALSEEDRLDVLAYVATRQGAVERDAAKAKHAHAG
jgi:transcriptional regulator with XRE-family HTH domain